MILHKILLALFPVRFQRHYGPEWEGVAEDLLASARSRGRAALAIAWLGLLADTLSRAPVAHARQWQADLVGSPPVLAGLGPHQVVWVLGRHWFWRPVRSILRILSNYGAVFLSGVLAAIMVYMLLERSALIHAASQMTDDTVASSLRETFPLLAATLVVIYVVLVSLQNSKKWWRRWKVAGFPVMAPVLLFFIGMMMGLHVMLMSNIPSLAVESTQVFEAFPAHRKVPVEPPSEASPTDWTPAQTQWFTVVDQGLPSEYIALRPEYRQRWCDGRLANLRAQRIALTSGTRTESPNIAVLLWNGQLAMASFYGCLPLEEVLLQHQQMAQWAIAHPGLLQLTWEPLTLIPTVDLLVSGNYLVVPTMLPRVLPYCQTLAAQQARATGARYDARDAVSFCQNLDNEWRAKYEKTHPMPSATHWQRLKWRLGLDHASFFRRAAQVAPMLEQKDLVWIRQQLVAHREQGVSPSAR